MPRDRFEFDLTEDERILREEMRSRINVARSIAQWRLRNGLSQDELGRRANSKQSRISELEGLRGNVRFDTLDRVAMQLGLMIVLVERNGEHFDLVGSPVTTTVRTDDQRDAGNPADLVT